MPRGIYKRTAAALHNMSLARQGMTLTAAARRKISIALTGRKPTAATRRKISLPNQGKKHTAAARRKMSLAKLGKPGKKHTTATRRQMSLAKSGEKNAVHKLTRRAVNDIRHTYKQEMQRPLRRKGQRRKHVRPGVRTELAAHYGVDPATTSVVARGAMRRRGKIILAWK
jgi:hypothetical protein